MKGILTLLFLFGITNIQAQTVPSSTGSKVKKEDAQSSLDFHNKARKEVGIVMLEWSPELAAFAQAWADNLTSGGCKIQHRPQTGSWAQQYGENIYFATDPGVTTLTASKAWYNEINDYSNQKINVNNIAKVGHYTQMVWRSTTKMGIGVSRCPSGATIIVANYSPRGNFLGERPY